MFLFRSKKKKEEEKDGLPKEVKDKNGFGRPKSSKILKRENTENIKTQKIQKRRNKDFKLESILVRPLITEKAGALGVFNQYVFEVSGKANKVEVKKSVEQIYGVRPMSVNMSNVLGKGVRFGRRISQCKSWRKAIVTLREGDKIEVYEGV